LDTEEGPEQRESGGSSPKRARVETEPTRVDEAGPSTGTVTEVAEASGDRTFVRSPQVSRIPRPVGNPVASSSSSEVDT